MEIPQGGGGDDIDEKLPEFYLVHDSGTKLQTIYILRSIGETFFQKPLWKFQAPASILQFCLSEKPSFTLMFLC